jgi:hypothetical protein
MIGLFYARCRRIWGGTIERQSRLGNILFHAAIGLIASLIVISRRPDVILNPQFFAEDGARWYVDAYNLGLRSLLVPESGYLHTLTRLTALFTVLLPLSFAPLVMNFCALMVQVLPVSLFLSRFPSISFYIRALASFLYLALPNTYEIHANITTLQWHLAMIAFLVLLAPPAATHMWRAFDSMVLVLISLDGPLGVLLIPIAAVLWHAKPALRARNIPLGLLLPGALIQAITILFSHMRPAHSNGASITRLISILGRQVFLASLLGMNSIYGMMRTRSAFNIEVMATAVGVTILLYGLWRGPVEIKLLLSFASMVFAAALTHPLANPTGPQWEFLRIPGCGTRYYFFPMIAFLTTLFWCLTDVATPKVMRYLVIATLLLLPVGIYRDWRYPAFVDFRFKDYAAKFEAAPPGTEVQIPINPPGWAMRLTKH